jgi:hypothetical protein
MAMAKAFIYINLHVLSRRSSFQVLTTFSWYGTTDLTLRPAQPVNGRTCASVKTNHSMHVLEGSGVAAGGGAASGVGVGASSAEHSRHVLAPA